MPEPYAQYEALHAQAMSHANDAFAHRFIGRHDEAVAEFREAWRLERMAAMGLVAEPMEPSRSILFQSAASLALLAGEIEDARRLAHLGLGGDPPPREREVLLQILADADTEDQKRTDGSSAGASVSVELQRLTPEGGLRTPIDVTWNRAA